MLSIAAMGAGSERYYLDLAREDYYLEGGEPLGRWAGSLSTSLALPEHVSREALRAFLDGRAPAGRVLVQQQNYADGRSRQPGWDLTFSAPKSVSVLWALSDPATRRAVEQAHHEAVLSALGYLEQEAGFTRRGKGGAQLERARFLAATFEHGTSRAQDPQLHTHALVPNVALRADGSFGTLRSQDLYRHKMAAGALYRSHLAAELTRLGFRLRQGEHSFEVMGVPSRLTRLFSKRRQRIEESIAEHGFLTAKEVEQLSLSTRERKGHIARDELLERWLEESGRGLQVARLGGSISERRAGQLVSAASSRVIRELARERHTFTRRDVVARVASRLEPWGLTARALTAGVGEALGRKAHSLGIHDGHEAFTTTSTLRQEARVLDTAAKLAERRGFRVGPAQVQAALDRSPVFNEGQKQAFNTLTDSSAFGLVSGVAGTGKTTLLCACNEAWSREGYTVIGAAVAGKAAVELEAGSGIQSRTIESWMLRRRFNQAPRAIESALGRTTVLVIDEASMASTQALHELLVLARWKRSKVVLVGDERQLPPVEGVSPFASLLKRLPSVRLTKVVRQREEWMRQAVTDIAEGRAEEALRAYAAHGHLHTAETRKEALFDLVDAWDKGRTSKLCKTLIFAQRNEQVSEINRLTQQRRLFRRELGAQRTKHEGTTFYAGDRILIGKNNRKAGVTNGDLGTIRGFIHRGVRAPIVFVQLDRKTESVAIPLDVAKLQLAYAVTTHKGQGTTTERAFVLAGDGGGREIAYVQLSRARLSTDIFISKGDAGEDLASLAQSLERSRRRELALDIEQRQEQQLVGLGHR